MDEQEEKVTSVDPKTGESQEVTLVLDHVEPNDNNKNNNSNMKLSVEQASNTTQKSR
jgi:hypothetical protein